MKKVLLVLITLVFSSSTFAISPDEKEYIRENCQDILRKMKEGKDVKDDMVKALQERNEKEWKRISTCVTLISEWQGEVVTGHKQE